MADTNISSPPRRGNRSRGRGPRSARGDRHMSGGSSRGNHNFASRDREAVHFQTNGTTAPNRNLVTQAQYNENNARVGTLHDSKVDNEEETEGDVCFICASPVVHTAIAPCNHRTCHICSLRMRALYKNKSCAHCRTEWDWVVLTDSDKNFQDFEDSDIAVTDSNLGIQYEKKEIQEDTLLLLRYNCPDQDCDVACLGWPDLHRHVKSVHHKVMCDLCTRNKKVFTHEHELFTKEELRKHEERGDDKPGSADQSGFRGHPKCGFCRQHFYSDDELYKHCREKHERCHICDRLNPGHPQYYLNYDTLEQHFRADHFLCLDRDCLDKKFVVFESEMDLRAHQIEAHPNGLTKDHRRVDLSDFAVRERYTPSQNGRAGRAERESRPGRGRDPNAEPLPASSAQPLRRDEIAFQRTMAIHNSQPAAARTFNGQLSSRPARPDAEAQARARAAEFPSLSDTSRAAPSSITTTTSTNTSATAPLSNPEQEARQLRHQAVLERASNLLKHDTTKLDSFRAHISSYKNSTMTAPQLIETFFSLFDASSTELGKLVKELADIFEIASKKDSLLKAWNDWRAINEDYPSLPGSSSQAPSVTSKPHGGNRVLRLKSSTAQSSRVANSQNASWGAAAGAASGSTASTLFPSLPVTKQGKAVKSTSTPWAGAMPPSATALPVRQAKPQQSSRVSDASAFPALPTAAKPSLPSFTPGFNGPLARRAPAATNGVSAWGPANATTDQSVAINGSIDNDADGALGKKKGRKKQTLIHFG